MRSSTVDIDTIKVDGRFRQDLGDLEPLAESIAETGLLHPVVVTSDMRLVAGQRRLEALRMLGETEVEVRVADDLDGVAQLLVAERDENTCRKDMAASELYALGKALDELERPNAVQRMADGGRGVQPNTPSKTRDVVAPAVGLSGPQWGRLKHIGDRAAEGDEAAADTLARIDQGEETVSGGYTKLRQQDIVKAPGKPKSNGDERTKLPAAKRAAQIRDLAAEGYRADQIAERIGIGAEHVRDLARKHDITLPDAAIGKRRAIDPRRVVSEAVGAVEGAALGLGLIDLDRVADHISGEEAQEWEASLKQSLRSLNRLRDRLKEASREQV